MRILLAHLVGDYVIQSDWMASHKTQRWWPAILHAVTYGLSYLLVTRSVPALAVIISTHAVIDRYRLARYLVFAKNFLAPRKSWPRWTECSVTGYPKDRLEWLAVWLMIIADNTVHLAINWTSVVWL